MTVHIYARVEYDGGRIVEQRHANGWSIGHHGANPDTRYWPPDVSLWDRIRIRLVWWLSDPAPEPHGCDCPWPNTNRCECSPSPSPEPDTQ